MPSTCFKNKKQNKTKKTTGAGYPWLSPVILATQEAEIRRITVAAEPEQIVPETLSEKKTHHKKGLAEWLKV
jgi:hypothetical protein